MEYVVCRGTGEDWRAVPAVELRHTKWLKPSPVRAWARLCHDGKALYVSMEAEESPVRASLTGQLEQVCDDSCLEFFFAPMCKDRRYFNFEWNPLGTLYLGFGGPRAGRVRQIVKNPEELFRPRPWIREGRWGICFQVPEEFICRYMPEFELKGDAACNFYKCGDKTVTPHYLTWSPLDTDTPDFHRRQDFGIIHFA